MHAQAGEILVVLKIKVGRSYFAADYVTIRGVQIRSDRIQTKLLYVRIGSDFFQFSLDWIRSDQILSLFSRIGSDFVLILSVWKKLNNEKSAKFNEKVSQTMREKLKGQSTHAACYPSLGILPSQLSASASCTHAYQSKCHKKVAYSSFKLPLIQICMPCMAPSAVICIYILLILECSHAHVLFNTKVLFKGFCQQINNFTSSLHIA